ncbi:MAG: lysophospholipid acyltransferase family protein [Myxococcota bacterium]|nr:lysophospholipid acyltransferase family protein [Myxococcota bacterium]
MEEKVRELVSEEPRIRRWARRTGTVSAIFVGLAVSLGTAPLWILVLAVIDGLRGSSWARLRCGVYLTWLLFCEAAGLLGALVLWLWPSGSKEVFQGRHYTLQNYWAGALLDGAVKIFNLKIEVEGEDVFERGPLLLFMRHATVVDTLLPAALVSRPHGIRMRYVLKRELRIDPCLDIVGDRVPNAFVRRGLADGSAERDRVIALARDLGPRDGVVIYPEGTRFTPERQARILEKVAEKGDARRLAIAESFKNVLPPRLGGVMGLLDMAPQADVVFCAHSGMERLTRLGDVLSGQVLGAELRVLCWRVRAEDIPSGEADREVWLEREWRRVDEFVTRYHVEHPASANP